MFCKNVFFRSRVETDWRAAGADRSQDATGVHGSAAPKEATAMAVILFTQQAQAQAQKGQQEEATYEEFKRAATGVLVLRGQHIVDENGLRTRAASFLEGMLKDEQPLTPCTRYREENDMFVSPLTRARQTGWAFGNAFISVNTLIGLISPGYQLPEYKAVRAVPRPNGQVNDDEMMWVIGPWSEKTKLLLFATDGSKIERLEDWIARRLQALQPN